MAEVPAPEGQMNGGATVALNPSEPIGSKRQRRPSVRLGDIGDQPYDSHPRRTTKPWRLAVDNHHHHLHRKDAANASGKPSKTRPLTNLSSGSAAAEFGETLEGEEREGNLDSVVIGSWKVKDSKKRGSAATKRVRSNWVPRIDEEGGGGCGGEGEDKYSGGEDLEDGYRDFEVEISESPIHSMENLGVDGHGNEHYHQGNRRSIRGREHHDGIELSGPSDTDRNGNEGRGRFGEDGVRIWLNGLGLGRYAPVFEIHEVDDEVLPLLTLEDLKDMGINAVGSRRKMYCAIQKLGKGFS
ncbi:uncharacterized protein LOC133285789 [Gastrolobium bilobum]|uniref:uncharacterized protein LOC133285789 n=1 Tax=Gastrolobium bilobum TaxID=150636 RepID=UPI002AB30E48|nr:uncharacterized protein LOC133285789 [Gastrolobium bilobum]